MVLTATFTALFLDGLSLGYRESQFRQHVEQDRFRLQLKDLAAARIQASFRLWRVFHYGANRARVADARDAVGHASTAWRSIKRKHEQFLKNSRAKEHPDAAVQELQLHILAVQADVKALLARDGTVDAVSSKSSKAAPAHATLDDVVGRMQRLESDVRDIKGNVAQVLAAVATLVTRPHSP